MHVETKDCLTCKLHLLEVVTRSINFLFTVITTKSWYLHLNGSLLAENKYTILLIV